MLTYVMLFNESLRMIIERNSD